MNKEYRWPLVAVLAVALVGVVGMLYIGVPESTVITVVGLVITPILAAFGASHLAGTREAVATVQQQTNGNTSRLLDIVAEQSRQLAASNPGQAADTTSAATSWPPQRPALPCNEKPSF